MQRDGYRVDGQGVEGGGHMILVSAMDWAFIVVVVARDERKSGLSNTHEEAPPSGASLQLASIKHPLL